MSALNIKQLPYWEEEKEKKIKVSVSDYPYLVLNSRLFEYAEKKKVE